MSGRMSDLAPSKLRGRLQGSLGKPYLYAREVSSTMDVLRGAPEGAVAVAEHQTRGRGRSGRLWEDEPGLSLLCSVLLRPASGLLPQLSLVAALATAEALEAAGGVPAAVKWPNDILLDGRKVAGILLEARDGAVIVGIGVNVNQGADELPAETRLPATSLRLASGIEHDRGAVLAAILAGLEVAYVTWRETGLEQLLARLEALNALAGTRVRVGGQVATAGAFAADGRLTVTLESGTTVLVESGEVEPA
jgi:BirA family transcriptional regulator, biotin operon repressor / biotin---[acetyl-CoA-carboxylase] ligase